MDIHGYNVRMSGEVCIHTSMYIYKEHTYLSSVHSMNAKYIQSLEGFSM